jgi:hypothetical protein
LGQSDTGEVLNVEIASEAGVLLSPVTKARAAPSTRAIRRRINLILFIDDPGRSAGQGSLRKLKAEWPGVLQAIEGCLRWQKYGLARADGGDQGDRRVPAG